jgi:hypothetical protein
VPDAASALPEVAHGQAHVLEATRFELHLLQQLMCPALVLVASGGEPVQLLQARGEPVAQALELREAEQRGAETARLLGAGVVASHFCASGGGDIWESLGDDRRELTLEPCDLGPQRSSRRTLAGASIVLVIE